MRKGMMCVLALMALLTLPEPVTMAPTAAAPATSGEEGVYEEDFTAYTYKDYVENTEWDIWARTLRLARMDAVDQVHPAVAAAESGNAIVVWVDTRNSNDDIYIQKLDARGNLLWAADVRVNSDTEMEYQRNPAVAADSSGNAIIVWVDYRNHSGDIYAQRLDESGNKLWTVDLRVNSDSWTAAQDDPAVAMDGDGNAIIVWEDPRNGNRDIYAQKLDGSGNKLWVTDTRVNSDSGTTDQESPAVAMDSDGNAIIVWEDARNGNSDVYAQKLDGSGNRLWTADTRVNSDNGTADQCDPAVAAGQSRKAVVVWEDRRTGFTSIYAQRLDESGNKLWTVDVYVNSHDWTADPAVAMDGDGNAIIVWEDPRNGDFDIYAQKLDGSGNKLWVTDMRVNSDSGAVSQMDPAVAINVGGDAFVVWRDLRNTWNDIYAQKLDGSGNRLWKADTRVHCDSGTVWQRDPAVATNGSGNTVIVWEDWRSGNPDIYAHNLDASGNLLWVTDARVNSDSGTADQYNPAVAMDSDGNAIIVWQDPRTGNWDIYAQKLDGSGNKLWAADVRVNSDSETANRGGPAVAMDGSGNAVVVWRDRRNGDHDIYAQKLDWGGNRLWATDTRVNSDSGTQVEGHPAVATDGSANAVVVWDDTRSGDFDVYAQRLDWDGNRLWSTDVRVNSDIGTTRQWNPSVAVDASGNAIVLWEDGRSPYQYRIYAQKVNGSGNKLWAADVCVNSDIEFANRYDPAVAADGSGNAIGVWVDYRNAWGDIYSQKLDESGNKLWAADTRVNSDSGTATQRNPTVATDRSGGAFVAWEDHRNGNRDIFMQRIDAAGEKVWLTDSQAAHPDRVYLPTGTAQSRTVDTIADGIAQATLTADYQPNGGEVQFYLTNDAGAHWAQVTAGVTHVFTTTGSDLRWRAVLTADPVWLRTPIVNFLRIEYSAQAPGPDDYEPDDTCAQASPLQVNGAVQAHTFHQPDDEDWAWFNATAGTTYVLQTTHAGPNADTVLELDDICDHPVMTDTNAFGHDARLIFTAPSDATLYAHVTNLDGSAYGEDTDYDLSVRTYHPNGLAVVVAGHNDAWQLQSNIDCAADQAYLTLLVAGFPRANVRYLGPNPNRDVDGNGLNDDIAATATITNVRYAIQDWPREQGLALGVPFYVYLIDHGHYDQFLANGNAGKVTAPLLDLWVSNLEATTGTDQITVIIDACKSGSFIDVTEPGPAEISGLNRVIVASTTSQANAYPSVRGALFSDVFWTALGDNQDVWSAYRAAKAAVDARGLMQTPWLDDNGDAVANEEDGDLARGRGLAGVFGGSEPVIDWLTVGDIGASGTATVAAQVRDDFRVTGVHVEVYPPGYEEPEGGPGETPVVGVPTTTLALAETDTYKATLTGLTASGTYRVVGYAVDDEGNWALPRWMVVEGQGGAYRQVYLPLVLR